MEDEVAALVCTVPDLSSGHVITIPFRLLTMVLACARLAVRRVRSR